MDPMTEEQMKPIVEKIMNDKMVALLSPYGLILAGGYVDIVTIMDAILYRKRRKEFDSKMLWAIWAVVMGSIGTIVAAVLKDKLGF